MVVVVIVVVGDVDVDVFALLLEQILYFGFRFIFVFVFAFDTPFRAMKLFDKTQRKYEAPSKKRTENKLSCSPGGSTPIGYSKSSDVIHLCTYRIIIHKFRLNGSVHIGIAIVNHFGA